MTIQDIQWLNEVVANYHDADWLDKAADDLYDTLHRLIRSEKTIQQATEVFLIVFPFLMAREDLRRWGSLFKDTLRVFNKVAVNKNKPTFYVLEPRERKIRLTRTRRRPREKVTGPEIFEIYMTLLMSTTFENNVASLTSERLNEIFMLGRAVNNQELYHKWYQTLTFIYNKQNLYDRAVDMGHMAYNYWAVQDNNNPTVKLEIAMSAYALAQTYSGLQQYKTAVHWFDLADTWFSKLIMPLQQGIVSMHRAQVYLKSGYTSAAVDMFERCLQDLRMTDARYYTAEAQQGLGLALGRSGQFDAGAEQIEVAQDLWLQIEAHLEYIESEHILAQIESYAGHKDAAVERLQANISRLDDLDDPRVPEQREQMQQTLADIRG